MLKQEFTTQFKKDYKLAVKRGYCIEKLEYVINKLCLEQTLPPEYNDHPLQNSKQYKNVRECHIEPDWLLIYKIINDTLVLQLMRTGTHSDLFN